MRSGDAVRQTPDVADALQPGIQALSSAHRGRVRPRNTRLLRGSINLDGALRAAQPNATRWDYGVGLPGNGDNDKAIWIEFHPASSSHVDEVIRKCKWLRSWLSSRAPELDRLTPKSGAFKWVATGSVALQKGSPQFRRVASAGIDFCGGHLSI